MLLGKIKWYDRKRGFGFVISEFGKEYFFHKTGVLMDNFVLFHPNENVVFELSKLKNGKKEAVNLSSLDV